MFRRCGDYCIESGVLEQVQVVVIGLRSVAAHGLDAIFAAGEITSIGVANGGHSSERWTAVVESLQKVVAASTYADPADMDHAVGILRAENPGRVDSSGAGESLDEAAAGDRGALTRIEGGAEFRAARVVLEAEASRCARMDRFGPWRSLASALAWGARGPEFKSRRPDQLNSSKSILRLVIQP
jgi:hypothetical protein